MAWKWQREDTGQGVLNSEQHLLWQGVWPDDLLRHKLPAMMEAAHFRSVERYSFGLVRYRREQGRVLCPLLGLRRLPALAFVDAGTRVTPQAVERVWTISPGLMARRSATLDASGLHGTLTMGLERLVTDGEVRLHAYERVEAFPSRFLRPPVALAQGAHPVGPWWSRPFRWLARRPLRAWLWALVGALYRAYHARASFGGLHEVAALIGAPPPDGRWRLLSRESWPGAGPGEAPGEGRGRHVAGAEKVAAAGTPGAALRGG